MRSLNNAVVAAALAVACAPVACAPVARAPVARAPVARAPVARVTAQVVPLEGPEMVFVHLGLKAKSVVIPGGQGTRVTAVLLGGPAQRSDVQPGDYLWDMTCYTSFGRRAADVVVSQFYSDKTQPPYVATSASEQMARGCPLGGGVSFLHSQEPKSPLSAATINDARYHVSIRYQAEPTGDQWITERSAPVADVGLSHEDAVARFDKEKQSAFEYLIAHPCESASSQQSAAAGRRSVREIVTTLRTLAKQADVNPPGGDAIDRQDEYWTAVQDQVCLVRGKNGPPFETILLAMYRGAVDPCTYSPTQSYEAALLDPKRMLLFSPDQYAPVFGLPTAKRVGNFSSPKAQCMLDVIRARLSGAGRK